MKTLETTDLVLRISSEIQENNLTDFEATALGVIDGINLTLETEQDFAEAKQNIKSCKAIEINIANAAQQAITSQDGVAKVMQLVNRLQDKFRETRLTLEKTVKAEETRIKKKITDSGIKELTERVLSSVASHGFRADTDAIRQAIKGKRSISKMEESVAEVVEAELQKLNDLEHSYTENSSVISSTEADYPGLFPDKETISLKPSAEVNLIITARVETFKNQLLEKEKKEDEARKKKEELEARIEAEAKPAKEELPPKVTIDIPPPPPLPNIPSEEVLVKYYNVRVGIDNAMLADILMAIRRINGVSVVWEIEDK